MSVETDRLVGTDLAGYRIESVLGRGGMGVVYLATDLRLERKVALKLVAPELAGDPRFRERFLRESRLAASLDHSHVVPVYAAGELDGQLWIAMRYVQGTDLRSLLDEQGPLEPARAAELCSQIASALDAAHAVGLVHRDVKPANVLVTQEGEAEHCYLTDFGLARTADLEIGPASGAHLSGTVDYTAPEQIAAQPADSRADVYSLGCVLYECLAGEPPFKRPRAVATLFAHASEPPPSLHERRPELPEAIDEVIDKALAKDARERYPTCHELVEATRDALGLRAPRFTRRQLLAAGAGTMLAVAAAGTIPTVVLTRGERSSGPVLPLEEDSLLRVDPATNAITRAIPIDGAGLLVFEEGSIWVTSTQNPVLAQFDPYSNAVSRTIDASEIGVPGFLVAGEGAIWIGRLDILSKVWRYSPRSGSFEPLSADAPDVPDGIAVGEGAVWVVTPPAVLRIEPATGEVLSTVNLRDPDSDLDFFYAIAAGEGAIWVSGAGDDGRPDNLVRYEPTTGVTSATDLGAWLGSLAVGGGSVWAANLDADEIVRVDPATNRVVDAIGVGRIPSSFAVGPEAVWVASKRDGTVTRVDPSTADLKTIDVGGIPIDVAVGASAIWVAVDAE